MNSNLDIKTDELRIRPSNSEVNRLYGDNTLIRSLTDWQPTYSGKDGFRKGLNKTIEWFTNIDNLSAYKTQGYSI